MVLGAKYDKYSDKYSVGEEEEEEDIDTTEASAGGGGNF